jgi:hypothetical protein
VELAEVARSRENMEPDVHRGAVAAIGEAGLRRAMELLFFA